MGCVSSKKGEDVPGMGKPCPDQQNQAQPAHYVKDPTTGNATASKSVSNHSHPSDKEEYQLLNCKMQFRNITGVSCYLTTVKSKMSYDDAGTEKKHESMHTLGSMERKMYIFALLPIRKHAAGRRGQLQLKAVETL